MNTACMVGVVSLFLGGSMMPLMFGRMARSHAFRILPGARIKLLASGFITVAILSLPIPLIAAFGYGAVDASFASNPEMLARIYAGNILIFKLFFTSIFLLICWLSVAMWFITSERNTAGFVKGLIVIAVVIVAPTRHIKQLDASVRWSELECLVTVAVFSTCFLLWPRLRSFARRIGRWPTRTIDRLRSLRVTGREVDLLLGTANPWLLALAQVVPILLAARIGYYSAVVWLFYLTIFSTVAGAIAGQAAERSRSLWLRGDWSRAQLFAQVERSFWRHNSFVLGVLLVLMVAIGSYSNLPAVLLAAGLPLLMLGTVLSTYLGLMVTRGLRWMESILAIGVMMTLMAVAVLAARSADDLKTVIALELALAVLAVTLRYVALGRWIKIDWTQCRPDRALTSRSAA
ncbi:MAG TPA: hypothetical protein VGO41_01965 [Steroidobacteraceae bacterium]|nr:hypothetical protein [Steroidobacteraceae bacterium]